MALRTGHGTGAGVPRVEVLPPDELPDAIADLRPRVTGVERRENGTVASSEAARALGRRGGEVKAKRVRLARSLGLSHIGDEEAFAPYARAASAFRRHHCAALARAAGGECGAAPSSMVASAALQLAASRFLFDKGSKTGDAATFKSASQLADASRQNLLAAYELAVREAKARPQAPGAKAAAIEERLLGPHLAKHAGAVPSEDEDERDERKEEAPGIDTKATPEEPTT